MQEFSGPLQDLIRRLDELRPEPSLINLAGALEAANLTSDDVAPFVQHSPRSQHRSVVIRREHYELVVFTWMPGQGSTPHDHAGSVSAMLVLQGQAAEGSWRIATDGYCDLEYETMLGRGELTAWHDAGIHTVRNASTRGEALVAINVYAPPLRDYRRYVPRPEGVPAAAQPPQDDAKTIAIVGGGFSGAMTAAQILRQAHQSGKRVRVALIERQGAVGEGLAYGTREICHLLNVPAGRMSAWPDRPTDFVDWATSRYGPVKPGEFLPRKWYGEYVRESLLATAQQVGESARLIVIYDEVRRLARRPASGWMVHFARGKSLPADAVVLAVGHRPPPDPIGRLWTGPRTRFIADPWRPFAMNVVAPDDPVVVLGSGLTAVDAVLSLAQEERRAPTVLISRRGLVPLAHAPSPLGPADVQSLASELLKAPGGVRARHLFAGLRERIAVEGQSWRSIVDGLRPHTAALWLNASARERRKFLTRLRPFWEVHRHRMAPSVANRFEELRKQELVTIVAGSVVSASAENDTVQLFVRERGGERLRELSVAWVVNCTGPAASNSAESNPAIGSLLVHGWVQPDTLSLGLETASDGAALDARGRASPDLYIVGTLRKPAMWESTAVPELRVQAAAVAERLLT